VDAPVKEGMGLAVTTRKVSSSAYLDREDRQHSPADRTAGDPKKDGRWPGRGKKIRVEKKNDALKKEMSCHVRRSPEEEPERQSG